jgi:hypothetical protein
MTDLESFALVRFASLIAKAGSNSQRPTQS